MWNCLPVSLFFFFFQAEDGIRDYKVTGVQTCALPIYSCVRARRQHLQCLEELDQRLLLVLLQRLESEARRLRSEERRVGKECGARWRATHEKENEGTLSTTTTGQVTPE